MQPDWAKVLGELLADHEIVFGKRIENLELALIASTRVSPEVAEQIAAAVRMLHELPSDNSK